MGAYAIELNMHAKFSTEPSEHSTDHPEEPGMYSKGKLTYKNVTTIKNVHGAPPDCTVTKNVCN